MRPAVDCSATACLPQASSAPYNSGMSHLILLRHGESQLNVLNRQKRVYCGQYETPLTDFGRDQAREAGRQLAAADGPADRAGRQLRPRASRETLQLAIEQLAYPVELLPPVAA